MSESFDFDVPGRFTVGALGEPGQRVFYFQVFAEGTEVAVKCEKQQAVALADHLVKLLEDLPGAVAASAEPAEALPPTEVAWAAGSISIGMDVEANKLLVVLEELVDPEEDDPLAEPPARLRVRLTSEQVRGYAAQVTSLIEGSRPICRLCEHPIDPSGHACPRLN